MTRIDHCQNLIHFTKAYSNRGNIDYEKSYAILKEIIKAKKLKGGNGMILGGHKCICFTEAPSNCLSFKKNLNPKYFKRYAPFGVQFSKQIIFKKEGRPVIYSKKEEYEKKKKVHKYKLEICYL
jgi:hypothetical protein